MCTFADTYVCRCASHKSSGLGVHFFVLQSCSLSSMFSRGDGEGDPLSLKLPGSFEDDQVLALTHIVAMGMPTRMA